MGIYDSYIAGVEFTLPTVPTKACHAFAGWFANSDLTTGGGVTTISTADTGAKEFWAKWTLTGHTPDGEQTDCTVAVDCSVCGLVAIPATTHITGGIIDCTLPDPCGRGDCMQNFREAGSHTPDGAHAADCTANDTCTTCGYDFENAGTHTPKTEDCTACVNCTATLNDGIHDWAAWTDGGENCERICTRCSVSGDAAQTQPHDWGEWLITTPPTATEKGEETRSCKSCEATETRDIYAVIWEADGGLPAPTQTSVYHGGDITAPAVMAKSGYSFGGWFMDNTFTTAAAFPIENVEEATTLYAKWTRQDTGGGGNGGGGGTIHHTVTFETDGGSAVNRQTVAHNGRVVRPANPEKVGYTFAGWFSDKELTTEFNFNMNITRNITIYAKWTVDEVTPTPTPDPDEWENPFIDVSPDDWFYDDVGHAIVSGIMVGTSANMFSPDTPMTRAMVVTVLYRLQNAVPLIAYENPFNDVDDAAYYAEAVKWAYHNGIVLGIGGNLFAPDLEITREQMAVILYRYQQYSGQIPPDIVADRTFNDESEISVWAADAVDALVAQGIIRGKPGGLFDPQGMATRAEIAAMLSRFMEFAK